MSSVISWMWKKEKRFTNTSAAARQKMKEFLTDSVFFGALISLAGYEVGLILKKRFKMAIFNPLLIGVICVMGILLIFDVDYEKYNEGGKYLSYLLTPATVCLAVPI